MRTAAAAADPGSTTPQMARARVLRELFEPWSFRRLEARTGIGRGTLQARFNGTTAITIDEIELLAPVIRMTPEQLFSELRAVTTENTRGPVSVETGPLLPEVDSNHQPAGNGSDLGAFDISSEIPVTDAIFIDFAEMQMLEHRAAKERAHANISRAREGRAPA